MKLIFDQNISHKILKYLPEGYDSTTVKEEGLINASDKEIWDFAKINNLNIVTQDSDFNDLNTLYGFPPKIIWIRLGNIKTQSLAQLLIDYYNEIESFASDEKYGCFEILDEKF